MKKFSKTLIVSDLDGTLADEALGVSDKNVRALRYFIENGGTFTYATGRNMDNVKFVTDIIFPNAPAITHNGAVICDLKTHEILWSKCLGEDVIEVLRDIGERFPKSAIVVCTLDKMYICRENDEVKYPENIRRAAVKDKSYTEVETPWSKVVLRQNKEETGQIREYVHRKNYAKRYHFCQTWGNDYQITHREASKGHALMQLKTMLPHITKTIAVGNNENDLEMIKAADVGYATLDAVQVLKDAADKITVSYKNHALYHIISELDN